MICCRDESSGTSHTLRARSIFFATLLPRRSGKRLHATGCGGTGRHRPQRRKPLELSRLSRQVRATPMNFAIADQRFQIPLGTQQSTRKQGVCGSGGFVLPRLCHAVNGIAGESAKSTRWGRTSINVAGCVLSLSASSAAPLRMRSCRPHGSPDRPSPRRAALRHRSR
jgi:hypothetical protein